MSDGLFFLALWSFILTTVFFAFSLLGIKDKLSHTKIIGISCIPLTVLVSAIVQISIESKYIYFVNLFGAISFFTVVAAIILMILYFFKQLEFNSYAIIFLVITLFFSLAFIPNVYSTTTNISTTLRTPFLIVHVLFAVLGEVMFFMGFVVCIAALLKKGTDVEKTLKKSLVLNIIGWIVFMFGAIIMGALWAKNSWGRYWGWDPKEVWSLITIVIYSIYFLSYKLMKKNSKVIIIISMLAFTSMLVTILGVSLFGSGLHSYK